MSWRRNKSTGAIRIFRVDHFWPNKLAANERSNVQVEISAKRATKTPEKNHFAIYIYHMNGYIEMMLSAWK